MRHGVHGVLDDGSVVAVKRLRDAAPASAFEFGHHIAVLSLLRHPNMVPRPREPARRVQDAEFGARQHQEHAYPLSSWTGPARQGWRTVGWHSCVAHRQARPEAPLSWPWTSQKGDVYAFEVVLLELLTGRWPGGRELLNGHT
jgi:hypothetical protein